MMKPGSRPSGSAMTRLDRLVAEGRADMERAEKERRERLGICGCGLPNGQCAPERCRHSFARDALWGNS